MNIFWILQNGNKSLFFEDMDYIPDATSGPGFMFGFSSNSLTIKEEALLYPFDSFLAEFGGSLGLFLGFSFLTVWDILSSILKLVMHKFKKN